MSATTQQITKSTACEPLHLQSSAILNAAWVSSESRWRDEVWRFDGLKPGSKNSVRVMNWAIVSPNGADLLSGRFEVMLDWLRRFVWTLYTAPASGRNRLSAGTLGVLNAGVAHLARWMMDNGYMRPDQLDRQAMTDYLEWIVESVAEDFDAAEESGQKEITMAFAFNRVRVPCLLWQQRHVLQSASIAAMPEAPWNGLTANEVTLQISTKARGWVKPIPTEVAVPILNSAAQFLGQRADDVLRLQEAVLSAKNRADGGHGNGTGTSKNAKDVRARRAVTAFRFKVLPGETLAWHPPIEPERYSRNERVGVLPRVRRLVMTLRDAATIVLQSATGMRVSEVCGLTAGIDPSTGWPTNVRVERSASGLNEIFILRSVQSKDEETPIDVDWVIGLRPLGTKDIPLPVQALLLLDKLFQPYRGIAGTDDLLVSLDSSAGLPEHKNSIKRITSFHILSGQRRFVEENVDFSSLPDESANKVEDNDLIPWRESHGRIIRTHQFRKFYAAFTLGVDPGLLPALQMHFHHVAQATTDCSYWGSNRLQVEPLSTVRAQETNVLLFQLATGKTLLAGAMGEQLEAHVAQIKNRIQGKTTGNAWKEVASYSAETDLRIWFAPHGMCLALDRSQMRCYEGTKLSPWLRVQPNFSAREASTCVGCKCFVVDRRHADYWEDKLNRNWMSYRRAELQGLHEGTFRVVKLRALQAKSLLSKLGADTTVMLNRLEGELVDAG